ncbi:MAG: hypothetical protein ACR2P3_00375 [Geminicoccaceae bacterium]
MTRARRRPHKRRRLLTTAFLLGCALLPAVHLVEAHNNPGFKEVLLVTIDISAEPIAEQPFPAYSEPFSLDLPKKTIELIWRIADGAADSADVTFAVAQGDSLHADGLTDGANSKILRGDNIRIVNVEGTSGAFTIDVYANVIDRTKPADS